MTDQVSVALLGYGLAGRWFHAPLIRTTPGMRVAAVVTRDPERAAAAAADLPDAQVLATDDEVWARADEFDLVVVATANVVHVRQAGAALEAGLPVVVDKPLAGTVAEAEALIEQARVADRPLMVFQNRRWDSDLLTLRAAVEAGELGAVHRWESRFERWRPERGAGWRESAAETAVGGVLFDLGAHLVDQALQVLGPAVSVYAERRSLRGADGADDDAFVAVQHAAGAVSHHWMSALAAHHGPRLRVLGDGGAFVVDGLDGQEDLLRAGGLPTDPTWGVESRTATVYRGVGDAVVSEERPLVRGDWPAFYRAVRAALREGGPVPVPATDALPALRVLEAAARSAAERQSVAIA